MFPCSYTAHTKNKFFIEDSFRKCGQKSRKLKTCLHLLNNFSWVYHLLLCFRLNEVNLILRNKIYLDYKYLVNDQKFDKN